MAATAISSRVAILATLLLLGVSLAACGRKGPLEPPPDPAVVAQEKAAADAQAAKGEDQANARRPRRSGQKKKKRPANIVPPKTPFILDPIL